jgi:hypothetical protein
MSIKISDDCRCLEIGGIVIATARERADGCAVFAHHTAGRGHHGFISAG